MKNVFFIFLVLCSKLLYGQNDNMFQSGHFQVQIAFSLMPVNITNSTVNFKYIDGNSNSNYSLDTIAANYTLDDKYFGNAINIGIGYFLTKRLRTSISLKPHFNSFLSNKSKNGKVYGIQFDLGLDYFSHISKGLSISFGTTVSRVLGGFGITSDGPKNKEYLVVRGNELYDNDIGFHIIDNTWAISPRIGLNYRLSNKIILFTNSGFQITFGRTSRMNFAGLQKDGTIKWNRKDYDDSDVNLYIKNMKISNDKINSLPYRFSGVLFDFGTVINLN